MKQTEQRRHSIFDRKIDGRPLGEITVGELPGLIEKLAARWYEHFQRANGGLLPITFAEFKALLEKAADDANGTLT